MQKYLYLNFSANLFYNVIDATNLGYSSNKSTISMDAKLAANLYLTKSTLMQLNAYYRSTRLTPQGEILPRFLLNLGMRQDLLENRLALTITISDLFKTLEWKRKIDTVELYQEVSSKRNSQIIYFGFTYRFGTSVKKAEKKLEFEDKI